MRSRRLFSILVMPGLAAAVSACSHSAAPAGLPPLGSAAQISPRHATIEEFQDLPDLSPAANPTALTASGKVLWIADSEVEAASVVARIEKSGKRSRTFYYQSGGSPTFEGVAIGSDSALWLTDWTDSVIVQISRPRGKITEFSVPDSDLSDIVAGPDGALWFAEADAVGRITTEGKITIYPAGRRTPGPGYTGIQDITVGPDFALWFTQMSANAIFRITTAGSITEFAKGISPNAGLTSIATGPDGALWFTEAAGRIGRITTAGKVSEYSRGITGSELPAGISAGPDNAMWFTESKVRGSYRYYDAKVGRITMSGRIAEYSVPTSDSDPTAIAAGPDGNMWFVETNVNKMGRIDL